jgi:Novel STAND NTPase 1/WD domain, G-beta repeat
MFPSGLPVERRDYLGICFLADQVLLSSPLAGEDTPEIPSRRKTKGGHDPLPAAACPSLRRFSPPGTPPRRGPQIGHPEARRQEETVAVAHEALIRIWIRLRGWLDEDRKFLLWRQRLRADLADWERAGRDRDALLRGRAVARMVHADAVRAVAFSPDGKWLATRSNNTARVWLWREVLWNEACARLPRNLEKDEWKRYLHEELYRETCTNLP